jgi:hypothetical protein
VSWTRVGVAAGALLLALGILAAALGNSPLRAPLIALGALVVLVGGGNLLNDWMGIKRKPQEFNRPDRRRDDTGEQ